MIKKTLLSFVIATSSIFLLSACTAKDEFKAKIINKIDTKIQQEKAEAGPTQTDDQLLKEIDSSSSADVDAQFSQLENEIK